MTGRFKKIIFAIISTLTIISLSASDDIKLWAAPKKKLIEFGWDVPNTDYLRKNIEIMEKGAPYDGICIKISAEVKKDGKKISVSGHEIFQNYKWERNWFKPAIDDLKNTKFKTFTDNFIVATTSPGNVDWFDDAAWENICNNFSIMAWIAKEGNCKGLLFDMEHYSENRLFCFNTSGGHDFDETWAKARERGKQFIKAITKEYPDITLFAVYWLDLNYNSENKDALNTLKTQEYGLSVPFINGVYDMLPENAKIVAGHEFGGYNAKLKDDFFAMKDEFTTSSKPLLTPENIDKYFSHTSLAVATYLDCYLNESGPWVIKSADMSRLDLFRRNLELAFKYSDEYVWTWGEQSKWWPIEIREWKEKRSKSLPGKGKLWEEALPGITRAINSVKDPMTYALAELKAGNLKNNLLKNPGFELSGPSAANVPVPPGCKESTELPEWNTWQMTNNTKNAERSSNGTFSVDKSIGIESNCSAKLSMVKDGCILQSIPVKPGETYFVRACALEKGSSTATLLIKWRDSEKKWKKIQNTVLLFSEKLTGNWKRASSVITIPEGVAYIAVQLNVYSNGKKEDICMFDAAEVYKLF